MREYQRKGVKMWDVNRVRLRILSVFFSTTPSVRSEFLRWRTAGCWNQWRHASVVMSFTITFKTAQIKHEAQDTEHITQITDHTTEKQQCRLRPLFTIHEPIPLNVLPTTQKTTAVAFLIKSHHWTTQRVLNQSSWCNKNHPSPHRLRNKPSRHHHTTYHPNNSHVKIPIECLNSVQHYREVRRGLIVVMLSRVIWSVLWAKGNVIYEEKKKILLYVWIDECECSSNLQARTRNKFRPPVGRKWGPFLCELRPFLGN